MGNYRLTKLLGRGGFADVYLGQHVTLGTLAAIKVLHTRLAPDDLAAFLKEAQTIARLADNAHILRVLDFDDGGGLPYLVMDYAPNGTLRSRHPAGTRVPLETVVGYVQQVAEALQFAHDQQPPIVHRDIKPENMLLGRQGEIRLSDFGIAVTVTQYVNSHAPSGTAAYMSPELFQGDVHRASDQYALGVVAYEWLCGTCPFPGPGYLQYGYQHVNNPPPPLSDKAPNLPPSVELVVLRALAKDPRARYPSVRAFAEALAEAAREPPAGTLLLTLTGHTLPVFAVTWSPDGRRLASASGDGTVRLWNAASGQPLAILKGHTDRVHAVAWSPDGRRLASASGDANVLLWDAASGQPLATLKIYLSPVNAVAWSPDGRRLASPSGGDTARLWDAESFQPLAALKGQTHGVDAVAWSPDGRRLASGSHDGTVRLWDGASGKALATLKGHTEHVNAVAWSPDGRRLASSSEDQTVRLWDTASGQTLATLTGHTSDVNAVAWSPDGRRLAFASGDGSVHLWDAASGQTLATLTGHTAYVHAVAWSPDGRRIASASGDGYTEKPDHAVRLWDAESLQPLATLTGHTDVVEAVAWSPDGRRLASAGGDDTVRVWWVGEG